MFNEFTIREAADKNLAEVVYYLLLDGNGIIIKVIIPSSDTTISFRAFFECFFIKICNSYSY